MNTLTFLLSTVIELYTMVLLLRICRRDYDWWSS